VLALFIITGLVIVVLCVLYTKTARPELDTILKDLTGTVKKLNSFATRKGIEITQHNLEVSHHMSQAQVKAEQVDRARRVGQKLNELVS